MELKDTRRIEELVEQSTTERGRVRALVGQGKWLEAEPDDVRRAAYVRRRGRKITTPGAESLIGDTIDLQGVSFLAEGAQVRRAVAHLDVTSPSESTIGSGFLISPRLLITNWHVVPDEAAARGTLVYFDKELDLFGAPMSETTFGLDPDAFFLASDENHLDYAVVALGPRKSGTTDQNDFGFIMISDDPDKHVIGMNVNIIQHPSGRSKMIAVRNNLLVFRGERGLLYETDTEVGSSGAPVFNDDWDLVALHHWGRPHLEAEDNQRLKSVNEGIRISAIYQDLSNRKGEVAAEERPLLEQALAYANSRAHAATQPRRMERRVGDTSRPPEPADGEGLVNRNGSGDAAVGTSFTIPIEVSVRVGSYPEATVSTGTTHPIVRTMSRGAEARRLDRSYENRKGYDSRHIPGAEIPVPKIKGGAAARVAPLVAGQPNAEQGELKYEHFSVKIDKSTRIALFSATNIDGLTYLKIDRETGEVVHDEEGETWYKDPRIDAAHVLEDAFYKSWSDYLDHGHVTRRNDPNWGSEESAKRANWDTFHLTNCSPQHWRFNQTTPYWQGAERYVLEKGVLDADPRKSVSVFQGPIFDDLNPWVADGVEIPSYYFKVIVWMGANGLRSVGLIVDQSALMSEARRYVAREEPTAPVDVQEWRVPITTIEQRTGLDFSANVTAADTMSDPNQPDVGGEAMRRIRTFDDLLS